MTYFFFFKPKRSKPLKVICRAITTAFHTCSFLQPGRPGHAEQRPAPCTLLTQVCSTPAALQYGFHYQKHLEFCCSYTDLFLGFGARSGLLCLSSNFSFIWVHNQCKFILKNPQEINLNLAKPISTRSFSFPVNISYPIKSPYIYIHTHTENPKSQNVS